MKKVTQFVVTLVFFVMSQATFADEYIRVGAVQISGGGLVLVGAISTTTAENNKGLEYLGWGLIIVGALINGRDLILPAVHASTYSGQSVWGAMVRESKVLSRNESLIQPDLAVASAAASFQMSTQDLVKLTLEVDKQKNLGLSSEQIIQAVFPNGTKNLTQTAAVEKLVALATSTM